MYSLVILRGIRWWILSWNVERSYLYVLLCFWFWYLLLPNSCCKPDCAWFYVFLFPLTPTCLSHSTTSNPLQDNRFVPGAGATEVELAHQLASYGETIPGLAQYAVKQYAQAFETMPKALAENAGVKATELLSKLYAAHQDGQKNAGFDIEVRIQWLLISMASNHLKSKFTKMLFCQ